ncbi:hypothetical protein B0T13DRAFT_528227 [Neurospora crassa]|nr:hypothetical protein B0T13DRAFT_528227 [Neurospora crassa]
METEKPTALPCTHPFSHPPSNLQGTATPATTPVNYSRPLDPSTSTNKSQQPTGEEKGKDKEAAENDDEGLGDMNAEKTPEPQLRSQKGDDDVDDDDDDSYQQDDGDEDEDEEEEEEEEEENEFTEVFQVLTNVARMNVFGERLNNAEGGVLSGGLGKAGWYHEVQYLGMRGDGVSDNGGSFKEGESEEESEGHGNVGREEREEKGQMEEEEGEEKGEEEEKERKEEEKGKETEEDDEENYVIVTFLGEQTDSDDESWYFVGITSSDEEEDSDDNEGSKGNKDTENNEDKKGNLNRNETNNANNHSKKGNRYDGHDSDNDEWHDHHHCHHCQSFRTASITTQTTTTTNPQQQLYPQPQEQGRLPLVNPPFEILQSSPIFFTIQFAITGAKRRDISVAYDLNTNVLTLSGVLYQTVLSVEDSSSASSSTSSSLESEIKTDGKDKSNARINQDSHLKSKADFEADLELWLAYEGASRPAGVNSGSGSFLLLGGYGEEEEEEEEEEEGKQGGGGDGGDGDSSTDTDDSNNKLSQTQSQIPPTTTEKIPIGQVLHQVNFVICLPTPTSECLLSPSSTPEEQKQHKKVNIEQIKARLEDGIPTVVVPLVEEEAEDESMVGMAM